MKSLKRIAVGLALAAAPVALGGAPAAHAAAPNACVFYSDDLYFSSSQGGLDVNTTYQRISSFYPWACDQVDAWVGIPAHVLVQTAGEEYSGGGSANGTCMAFTLSSPTDWHGANALVLGDDVLLADSVAASPTAFIYGQLEVNEAQPNYPCFYLETFSGGGVNVATG